MSAIEVILVDRHDRPIGRMEKLEVHKKRVAASRDHRLRV